ncbi:MAG: hypothetical protein RR982_04595 [Kiritimatiellia bacterium]
MKRFYSYLQLPFLFFAIVFSSIVVARETAPAAYTFAHPEAIKDWKAQLPEDCKTISPTCVYSPSQKTVYLLSELCGLSVGYEVEYLLIGKLSDRAYESFAIAWDDPSTVAKAINALGVPQGEPVQQLRGLPFSKGERFTLSLRRLNKDSDFRPLSDFVDDHCSTPAQALFTRGFPYVGARKIDNQMPAAILAAYTEPLSLFGLPYAASKGVVYGLFRAKTNEDAGTPTILALKWEQLPNGQARTFSYSVTITPDLLTAPDALLAELKTLCNDPRDVFLRVTIAPEVQLSKVEPIAKLLLALEAKGGFTLDAVQEGQITLRAFTPDNAWRERDKRVFQPWEVELSTGEKDAPVDVTLCQIIEDWTVEGIDPALTRKCYPGMTPKSILDVMKQVDTNEGKIYVVFFYVDPAITMKDLSPYARVLSVPCPTQWIFIGKPDIVKPAQK